MDKPTYELPPEPEEAKADSIITEEWCQAWIARHLAGIIIEGSSRRWGQYILGRVEIWESRLEYVREHGPTVLRHIEVNGHDADVKAREARIKLIADTLG